MTASIQLVASENSDQQTQIRDQLEAIKTNNLASELAVRGLLEQATGKTKIRVKLKLVSILRKSGQLDKAESLLDDIDEALINLSDNEITIDAIISRALFEKSRNNYLKATELAIEKALPIASPNSSQLASIYQHIGLFYRYQMKLVDAKKYYFMALKEYQKNNDVDGIGQLYGSLGVLYESFGDLVLAAQYQQKARVIFEKTGDKQHLATNYFNLGELYYRSDDLDKSLTYYLRALELDTELHSLQDIGYDHHRIATIYMLQKEYDRALQHTQEAVALFIKETAPQVLARAYTQQAKIYYFMGQFEQQLASLELAEKAALVSKSEHQIRSVWHSFGQYYLQQNQLDLSLNYGLKALALSDKLALAVHQFTDNKLLATLYAKLGQFKLGYSHLSTAFEIEQQLNSDQQIEEREKYKRDINLLEEQVKVTRLEQQRTRQKEQLFAQQAQNQRNILLFCIALVLLAVLIFLLFQRRKMALVEAKLYEEALSQKNQLLTDVSHELRTPLTALKLQIDALQHRIVKDVDVSYQKLSVKVMDINRLISDIYELAKTDTGELSLSMTEVDCIEVLTQWQSEFCDYVEQQGFEWRFQQFVDSAMVNIDSERLKQVLSNIIANSCFYSDKPGIIELIVKSNQKWLLISINDSSPGVAESELSKIFNRLYRVERSRNKQTGGSGLGLAICQSLIHAHGGDIIAKSSPLGGLSIKIKLPLS